MAEMQQAEAHTIPMPYKVLLVGPYRAGKSSLVRSIIEDSVCIEHGGSSVSLDFGCVVVGGRDISFFGIPGRKHFQFMEEVLGEGADACVLVVDSTDPDSFGEARGQLSRLQEGGIPAVVAANKQDSPEARGREEIRLALEAGDFPVVEVSARTKEGKDRLLDELVSLLEAKQ